MLIKAEKIANMPREKFVDRHHTACCSCGTTLHESSTGCRDTKDGPMCSDCYFKLLSKHIDENPINTPRDVE